MSEEIIEDLKRQIDDLRKINKCLIKASRRMFEIIELIREGEYYSKLKYKIYNLEQDLHTLRFEYDRAVSISGVMKKAKRLNYELEQMTEKWDKEVNDNCDLVRDCGHAEMDLKETKARLSKAQDTLDWCVANQATVSFFKLQGGNRVSVSLGGAMKAERDTFEEAVTFVKEKALGGDVV